MEELNLNYVMFSGKQIYDRKQIANKFNIFFYDSLKDIVYSSNNKTDIEIVLNPVNFKEEFLNFNKITMSELNQVIKSLKKTTDLELMIPGSVYIDAFNIIGNRFLDVVNTSLCSGVFSEAWKTTAIVPIQKVNNTIKCEEFRPINTVPFYEKVLESIVKEQLTSYCNRNNVITEFQSGFRKNCSCETVIINLCDTWIKAFDSGEFVLAVFLDFKRTFETVDRNVLMHKLEKIGLKSTVLKWFRFVYQTGTNLLNMKTLSHLKYHHLTGYHKVLYSTRYYSTCI